MQSCEVWRGVVLGSVRAGNLKNYHYLLGEHRNGLPCRDQM